MIKKLWLTFLDFILPRTERAQILENLSAEEFMRLASPAPKEKRADIRSVFSYQDRLVKDAIRLFKYHHDPWAKKIFGEISSEMLGEWLENLKNFENFSEPILAPVPMAKNKKLERGGNHIDFLCQETLKNLPIGMIKLEKHGLLKIKDTKSQALLKNRAERLKNVAKSMIADKKTFSGKNVVVIDDVMTTGATFDEARRALVEAGAKKIVFFALAR